MKDSQEESNPKNDKFWTGQLVKLIFSLLSPPFFFFFNLQNYYIEYYASYLEEYEQQQQQQQQQQQHQQHQHPISQSDAAAALAPLGTSLFMDDIMNNGMTICNIM